MKFLIMSRQNARRYSFTEVEYDTIIISITDVNAKPVQFNNNNKIKGILRLQFDDVDRDVINCITDEDAQKILKFVDRHIKDINCILVQCEAGISRSAGVCAALMFILTGKDDPIFRNPKYCPNRTCYRTILDQYYGGYDKNGIEAVFKSNLETWLGEKF